MKKRLSLFLVAVTALCILFSFTASADTGPKPSVRIEFENMSDEICYATLLSLRECSGPARVWDGIEEPDYYIGHESGKEHSSGEGDTIWKKMVEYTDTDNYYFLQRIWRVDETHELAWTYYPPESFKILLYYPESDKFISSGIYESYAFDSYYTVNMEGIDIQTVKQGESKSVLSAEKSYDYTLETVSLIGRIIVTIAIETAIALAFSYRKKREFTVIFTVNVITQILLNIALNVENFKAGYMAFTAYYIFFEIIIFVSEAVIYSVILKDKGKTRNILYALVSNGVSFGAGLILAHVIPGIF